jgi:hypothetical protein
MTQEELTTEGLDALKQFVVLIAKKVVEGWFQNDRGISLFSRHEA